MATATKTKVKSLKVETPYPRKNNHLKRLYHGLRRIVKHAST